MLEVKGTRKRGKQRRWKDGVKDSLRFSVLSIQEGVRHAWDRITGMMWYTHGDMLLVG